MRPSPITVGLVLGLVVGGAAAGVVAATSEREPQKTYVTAEPPEPPEPAEPAPGAIERLAAAFELRGPVEADAGGWVVRDGNRLLRVQRAAGLPWFFSLLDGPCKLVPESPPPSETLQTVAPSGPSDCPEPVPASVAPADLLSKADAQAFGMETLGRAGVALENPVIEDEPGGWYIQASPRVGATSAAARPWTITVGPGRTITAASGSLGVQDR